jgi:hypothetical protein
MTHFSKHIHVVKRRMNLRVYPQNRLDSFTFVFTPLSWQLLDSYEHDYLAFLFTAAVIRVFEDVT